MNGTPFLLELSFASRHLTYKKAPVTGTETLRWLSQAKPVTPVECGDDPLKGLVLIRYLLPESWGYPQLQTAVMFSFASLMHRDDGFHTLLFSLGKPFRKPPASTPRTRLEEP